VAADTNGYIYDSRAAICRILVGGRHVDTAGRGGTGVDSEFLHFFGFETYRRFKNTSFLLFSSASFLGTHTVRQSRSVSRPTETFAFFSCRLTLMIFSKLSCRHPTKTRARRFFLDEVIGGLRSLLTTDDQCRTSIGVFHGLNLNGMAQSRRSHELNRALNLHAVL
jgi:hypothetical protein